MKLRPGIFVLAVFLGSSHVVSALVQVNQVFLVDLKKTSIALEYDSQGNFLFYPLRDSEGVVDLTAMRYLSFWMKPDVGQGATDPAPHFYVGLHEDTDKDGRLIWGRDVIHRLPIGRFMENRSKGWQKVVIPLERFSKVRNWQGILQIAFILEGNRRIGRGKIFIDDLLFGSNYPEGFNGKEISMQNRVSSFKIGNNITALLPAGKQGEMKLKNRTTSLTLVLTFIDPYLEEIRFEQSEDGGLRWEKIESFYDHSNGGVYSSEWKLSRSAKSKDGVCVRATGIDVLGGETTLGGPYRITID